MQTLILLKYNNVWRMVEVYSYRKKKNPEPLLYIFCLLHNEWHSIYHSRVQGMVMTDETFTPRYPIEVM